MLPQKIQSICQNMYKWDALEEVSEWLDRISVHFFKMGIECSQRWIIHCFVTASRTVPKDHLRVWMTPCEWCNRGWVWICNLTLWRICMVGRLLHSGAHIDDWCSGCGRDSFIDQFLIVPVCLTGTEIDLSYLFLCSFYEYLSKLENLFDLCVL